MVVGIVSDLQTPRCRSLKVFAFVGCALVSCRIDPVALGHVLMIAVRLSLSLILGGLVSNLVLAQNFADRIISYQAGTGAGSQTNAAAVLGPPSRETVDPQWGTFPVDPFGPPYLSNQVVSLGAGGSLTVRLEHPVENDPANAHGLDLIVFGNSFFQLNADFTTASGALGGTNTGRTTVSVSPDGHQFFALEPALAPLPDTLFPTDGAGDPSLPVDPALTGTDFAGRDLQGIRSLYNGSAGGTGYDIGWAIDAQGDPVMLAAVRFVRFEQEAGEAQIDAVSGVAKGPAISEDFAVDPQAKGWKVHGEERLFTWNAAREELEVTWDSSQPNSYYYRPLGNVLDLEDDFSMGFTLELDSVVVGADPTKPYTFQLALALLRWERAIDPSFHRGSGMDPVHGPRDLLEFAYFPDSGFGATISPSMISGNNQFATTFNFPMEFTVGSRFEVILRYQSAERTMRTEVYRDFGSFGPIGDVVLPPEFSGIRLDTFAICSYSDQGQAPEFGGSILARGRVGALWLQLPEPPVRQLELVRKDGVWEARFVSRHGWSYELQRSNDLQAWVTVAAHGGSEGDRLTLADPTGPGVMGFYRIRAEKP
jgi:hypothetical protein